MDVSSIVRFEDLLRLWQESHSQRSILQFLGIRSHGDVRGAEEDEPGFMQILRERLDGTWWEVTWSRPNVCRGATVAVRCRYLADSLKDAVRRCPGAQVPSEVSLDDGDDVMFEEEAEVAARRLNHRRSVVIRSRK